MSSKNLSYSLIEKKSSIVNKQVTYENLLQKVNEDSNQNTEETNNDSMQINDELIALQINYNENYTKKQLERIIEYYKLSKRKKKKMQLVKDIILFEKNILNCEIVERRKILWYYIEEIKSDNYLSKFLILD
tara:strand:+ start:346 stop:741 length:396 start_codon:yes stop_codon:yes gene_type:complete